MYTILLLFSVSKVDLNSQRAYELATSGLLRARTSQSNTHIIYGIKLIDFKPPNFTLGKLVV